MKGGSVGGRVGGTVGGRVGGWREVRWEGGAEGDRVGWRWEG